MIYNLSGLTAPSFAELNDLYAPCCDRHPELVSGSLPNLSAIPDIEEALLRLVQTVWKKKGMPENIDRSLVRAFAVHYSEAVSQSFSTPLGAGGLDYDTPDGEMLASLQKNIYQFSAAKNYTQLKQLSQALIGEDGKLRTYSQFKGAAMHINDAHVNQWLRAEYNLAVASGQMAATWVRIQESKDYLPMLEFDAVLDNRTTETCRSLDGVVKPVDDSLWATYYPPNHFGCRSDVRQHASRTVTADDKIEYPEIPNMFKTNLAQKGLVFPPKHAYWIDCPEDILKAGENLIK